MELWHIWASPASMRVRAALAEKGLPYLARELHESEPAGDLRHRNPAGTLPMLVAGDEVVVGAVPIVTWLSDRWPEPPLFPAAVGREQVLTTCARVDRLFDGVLPRVARGTPEERVSALGEARRAMGEVDGGLQGDAFLLAEFSFADLTLASCLACLPRDWRPASLGHERLARWERLVMTRPSVREQMGPWVPAAA